MRIAVLADIHGNADALEAVLADVATVAPDRVVCLGDHLSGPMEARRTADRLIASDIAVISGNHDRWIVEKKPEAMGPSDAEAFRQLDQHHLDWLRALPPTLEIEGVLLCHGTPGSDTAYWLETVTPEGVPTMASLASIEAEVEGLGHAAFLCAHTHIPRAVRLGDERLVLNPGSVGCPGYFSPQPVPHLMQTGIPDAIYAIIERIDGIWRGSHRRVPYDTSRVVDLARRAGRNDWASVLATGWLKPNRASSPGG